MLVLYLSAVSTSTVSPVRSSVKSPSMIAGPLCTFESRTSQIFLMEPAHMFQILDELFDASGPQSKAVILAHNSHVGDARHSEMEARGEYNVGQLCREAYGAGAYLFGFWKPTAARLPLRVRRVLLLDGSYYCSSPAGHRASPGNARLSRSASDARSSIGSMLAEEQQRFIAYAPPPDIRPSNGEAYQC